jgi:formyltetrahydrofolate deformylase
MVATARLLIDCPDRPGVVAAVSGWLFEQGANITDSAQHTTDPAGGTFFMRMEFVHDDLPDGLAGLEQRFAHDVGSRFEMDWRFALARARRPLAVLVSRDDHCLLDLIWRARRGDLGGEIALVISNHADHADTVASFGIPFHHVAVGDGGMAAAEAQMLPLLDGVELAVLARYMRILSAGFLERLAVPAINIHHSFLPAFVGADPYRRALERGVKIIGATAHYVTQDLDEGPIIEQDVERVSHRHGLTELEGIGRDIERTVLARAVRWHLEDRVIVHGNKTVVFQ